MFAYLEGSAVGQELDDKIKSYKSVSYSSHTGGLVSMIDFCDKKLLRRNIGTYIYACKEEERKPT